MYQAQKIQKFIEGKLLDKHPCSSSPLEVGKMISFMAGYHDDNLVSYRIIGFGTEEDSPDRVEIYVDWDCYWYPLFDEEKRKMAIVQEVDQGPSYWF